MCFSCTLRFLCSVHLVLGMLTTVFWNVVFDGCEKLFILRVERTAAFRQHHVVGFNLLNFDFKHMRYSGTVLVAGATGRTGQWVVKRLEHYGIDYRLFVRSGEKALEIFGPEIVDRITIGSIENEYEIDAAVNNADAVICTIGGNVMDPDELPPSAIDRDGVIRIAQRSKEYGVRQFILVSSLAVTKPDHPLNKYGNVLTMKLEGENEVRRLYGEKGYSYTILRPGGLIDEDEPLQHSMLFDTGDRIETGKINRSDVAQAAVEALWIKAARNLTFELIQQDALSQKSFELYYKQAAKNIGNG